MAAAAAGLSLAIFLQPPPWQVFAEAGDKIRPVDYLVALSWIAALANIGILAVLALLCPWWADAPAPTGMETTAPTGRTPRWFRPAVLFAVLACCALTAPRLGQSLWDDEEYSLLSNILGRYKRSPENGELFLKEVRWRDTLFFNVPNNHILHNVLARMSNSAWRAVARPAGLQFKEWAMRIPAFLAALATVAIIGLLLGDIGMPLAGVLAAWLLALHPWFEKYGAEARGYSMAMLLVCAAVLFWRRALTEGRWLWWVLFALCQVLCLWTWPGALFFFVLLNAGTLTAIAAARGIATPRRTVLSRWFCCNALSAVILLQLMLPVIPEMQGYLARLPAMNLGAKWFADVGCYLATGSPWTKNETGPLLYPEIRSLVSPAPGVFAAVAAGGAALALWGIVLLWRRGTPSVLVITALVGAALLQIGQAVRGQMYLYEWYFVYLLPFVAAALGAGLAGVAQILASRRAFAAAFVVAVFAIFAFVTQPARARGLAHPTVPFRESVLLTRPDPDPLSEQNKKIITVGVMNPPQAYDPNVIKARSPRDLLLLCAQADVSGRPLWINTGHLWILHERQPAMERIVNDTSLFSGHQRLLGEYPHCDRLVCRYLPGSIGKADLSVYLSPEDIEFIEANTGVSPEQHFAR